MPKYRGILPYASELFGIYQPLIGWKSRLIGERHERMRSVLIDQIASAAFAPREPGVEIVRFDTTGSADALVLPSLEIRNLTPRYLSGGLAPSTSLHLDTAITRLLRRRLGSQPPDNWNAVVTADMVTQLLKDVHETVMDRERMAAEQEVATYVRGFLRESASKGEMGLAVRALFERECIVAGQLVFLAQHNPAALQRLFFDVAPNLVSTLRTADPWLSFGSKAVDAILSPIGVMHLYRQYFFELDSFLGPPVGHVWLSPGGLIELVEVSTRKVTREFTSEQSIDTLIRSETSAATQDDLADAVKEENRNDTKFGFSNTLTASAGFIEDTATASYSIDTLKATSRENAHKRMRQQSEKLSSEIKKNFKTTFRTSSETTDTNSRRYVIQNTGKTLLNYELRRKMRKVAVQVQDIATQLCWHIFVDDPGKTLGVSRLVHIGAPPDLTNLPEVPPPAYPPDITEEQKVPVPLPTPGGSYQNPSQSKVRCVQPGYTLKSATRVNGANPGVAFGCEVLESDKYDSTSEGIVSIDMTKDWPPGFEGNQFNDYGPIYHATISLRWEYGQKARKNTEDAHAAAESAWTTEREQRYKEAFYKSARERITLASKIRQRPSEELRAEERTVVYRGLIDQLTRVGTGHSKHVISELIRSIFDVDKMLYFVAPEWWAPRHHISGQYLGSEAQSGASNAVPYVARQTDNIIHHTRVTLDLPESQTTLPEQHLVDWGGHARPDNYFITEDSEPAKFGASLGWLLQLDGDNLRNAMLNSPWVKAVIPIRIGKEEAAINWLQNAHVEGSEGLGDPYVMAAGDPDQFKNKSFRDALGILVARIREADAKSRTVNAPIVPTVANSADAAKHFRDSLPTEAVFEHGYYPLQGGVRFEQDGTEQRIFSHWIEILPTDQVAALEVEYDPQTLAHKVVESTEPD